MWICWQSKSMRLSEVNVIDCGKFNLIKSLKILYCLSHIKMIMMMISSFLFPPIHPIRGVWSGRKLAPKTNCQESLLAPKLLPRSLLIIIISIATIIIIIISIIIMQFANFATIVTKIISMTIFINWKSAAVFIHSSARAAKCKFSTFR